MSGEKPHRVAILGGGCASLTSALELTRPELGGRYDVTLYQVGWRLGGKGASGRGSADRVEEHGLHLWFGFYENAFRLLRECYKELDRDPKKSRIADWRDAFFPDPWVGVSGQSKDGDWRPWLASFPPGEGLPGDPFGNNNPFTVQAYTLRTAALLRTLIIAAQTQQGSGGTVAGRPAGGGGMPDALSVEGIVSGINRVLRYGQLATVAAVAEAAWWLELALRAMPLANDALLVKLIDTLGGAARRQLEELIDADSELRRIWEIADIVIATLRGIVRFGLNTDPRGFDAIDDYDYREWLSLNGATEAAVSSDYMRGIYDLLLAYADGDDRRPTFSAASALRGSCRMFFTYRGSLFWKMRAGMGDVVIAPIYEVLRRRGVRFEFFHRLENVKLASEAALSRGETPHVAALKFDVQAEVEGGEEYRPLVDVRGLPCWPSAPIYEQLVDAERFRREGWAFESFWDRRKVRTKTLRVGRDFDFVIFGIGVGSVPYVCKELVERDQRWRDMAHHVKTVATRAFQIWMSSDMEELGWSGPPTNVAGFVEPFDTWADMRQLIPEESWPTNPEAIAYFCSVLPTPPSIPPRTEDGYPAAAMEQVRHDAVRYLNQEIAKLWPNAARERGKFRWELLVDPDGREANGNPPADEDRFASQFWTANVNPSDRYVLSAPGSARYRISPLDNSYDNLTLAGDWTECGLNMGCVEAAVISGRLAAHAISGSPRLEEIVGYDHP